MELKDIHKKNWLVPFGRELWSFFDRKACAKRLQPLLALPLQERFERWKMKAMRERGFLCGTLLPHELIPVLSFEDPKHRGTAMFVNTLCHQFELLMELHVLCEQVPSEPYTMLERLSIFAAHVDSLKDVEKLSDLADDDWGEEGSKLRGKLAKKVGPSARTIADRLKKSALHDSHQPLLGLPFYRVLVYADTMQLLSLAFKKYTQGSLEAEDVQSLLAFNYMQKVYLIETLVALAYADNILTRLEKRLLNGVFEMARLPKHERNEVWKTLGRPLALMDICAHVKDELTKRFLFEQVILQSCLEGDGPNEDEKEFIEQLAENLGIDAVEILEFEAETLVFLDSHPAVLESLEWNSSLRRYRSYLNHRIEHVVRDNMEKLGIEVRETKELVQLMLERTRRKLTEEEELKVKEQLLDICRSIPALAVFCVPGGSILLPLLLKYLPFELRPSAFVEKDEHL